MTSRCPNCYSTNVYYDAHVAVNDPADVRTYDDIWCEDCDSHPNHLDYKKDN